jgi:hypothetical protein
LSLKGSYSSAESLELINSNNANSFTLGAGGDNFYIKDKRAGTTPFFIQYNGNVGIGTTGPTVGVDVQQALARMNLQSTTGTNRVRYAAVNTGGTSYFGREDSTGSSLIPGASAYATVLGGDGAYPLHLYTNDAVRVTIDSSGNVGIGTTAPDQLLDVRGNISLGRRAQSAVTRYFGLTNVDGTFSNVDGTGTAGMILTQAANGDAQLQFKTGQWGVSEAMRMTITNTGNVGIGTTSPGTNRLRVVGNTDATSYSVSGTAGASGSVHVWCKTSGSIRLTFTNGILTNFENLGCSN